MNEYKHSRQQSINTLHCLSVCRSGERTGRRLLWPTTLLLPSLLSDSQVLISLVMRASLMNRFRTGQGPCRANWHKCGLTQSPSCDRGQRQTVNHIVNTCPSTKSEGGLNLLHEADDDAVMIAGIYSDCSTRRINKCVCVCVCVCADSSVCVSPSSRGAVTLAQSLAD